MLDAVLIGLAVILIGIVWIFPLSSVPGLLWGRSERHDPAPPWQRPAVVSWMGLRGAGTPAAALAVPLTTNAGDPFPDRSLILYLAFAVIVATVVFQGLTLPFVVRPLGVQADVLAERGESHGRV